MQGCDRPHRAKGFCEFHYFRDLRGIPLDKPVVKPNPKMKLTPDDVRQIRHMRSEGNPLRVIAARYGVSMCAVSKACRRDSWADVD